MVRGCGRWGILGVLVLVCGAVCSGCFSPATAAEFGSDDGDRLPCGGWGALHSAGNYHDEQGGLVPLRENVRGRERVCRGL
ncbi:MAG TPA: hypothetical protein ENN85_08195 [Methanoculleus sp.]|nr:hypothetical protein [Methanoculleus sp.]